VREILKGRDATPSRRRPAGRELSGGPKPSESNATCSMTVCVVFSSCQGGCPYMRGTLEEQAELSTDDLARVQSIVTFLYTC
jgi:hypothetical protein